MICIVLMLLMFSLVSALSGFGIRSTAVVGVGVLGTHLCRLILECPDFADSSVVGITKTTNRHEDIHAQVTGEHLSPLQNKRERFRLVTMEEIRTSGEQFDHVVFCAPPSGFEDYAGAVQEAVRELWRGASSGGLFVFTSSGAVYGPGDQETVTEKSPLADITSNPRIERLVKAEQACLQAGGCALRLAGLYNLQRGPHNFWLTSGKGVAGSPDGIVNMLHYEDAASACLAALRKGAETLRGRALLISDGHPITRRQICTYALQAKYYAAYSMPEFLSADEPQSKSLGKVYDGSLSNAALDWAPTYQSFREFMSMA